MAWAAGWLVATHKRQEAAAKTRWDAGAEEAGLVLRLMAEVKGGREVVPVEEEGRAAADTEEEEALPGRKLPVATEPLLPADCRRTLLFFSRVFPPGDARNASKKQAALRAKAASKFAKGLRCVQDRKLDLARAKFRAAIKARFLLLDNIHHLASARSTKYRIII